MPESPTPAMTPAPEETEDGRIGPSTRWVLVGLALGILTVLTIATRLTPSASGLGTHRQLGLPPCMFLEVTGQPCPSCGMTTAFAWFVRGELGRSFAANPAGLVLAIASVLLVPWLVACAAVGRSLGFRSLDPPLLLVVVLAVAVSLATWMVRRIL